MCSMAHDSGCSHSEVGVEPNNLNLALETLFRDPPLCPQKEKLSYLKLINVIEFHTASQYI